MPGLLEVVAVVAASTITNYTGSITKPPVEASFRGLDEQAVNRSACRIKGVVDCLLSSTHRILAFIVHVI